MGEILKKIIVKNFPNNERSRDPITQESPKLDKYKTNKTHIST